MKESGRGLGKDFFIHASVVTLGNSTLTGDP